MQSIEKQLLIPQSPVNGNWALWQEFYYNNVDGNTCGKKPFPLGFGKAHKQKVADYRKCVEALKGTAASSPAVFVTYQGKNYTPQEAYDYAKSLGFTGSFEQFNSLYNNPETKIALQNALVSGKTLNESIKSIVDKSATWEAKKAEIRAGDMTVESTMDKAKPYLITGGVIVGLVVVGLIVKKMI